MRPRVLCLLSLTWACSGGESDFASDGSSSNGSSWGIGQLEQPIVRGSRSDTTEDAALYVRTRWAPTEGTSCTGTLIAPNLVVTALHCVTRSDLGFFACNSDGTLEDENMGDGALGQLANASDVKVYTGVRETGIPDATEPTAIGLRLLGTGSNQICRNDLAFVVLDRDVDGPIAQIRMEGSVRWGEFVRVVGYGQTDVNGDAGRFTRSGVRILDVGPLTDGEDTGTAAPRTFVTNEGACHGDSGGPAFSEETGAIVGVYSLTGAASCSGVGVRNIYTNLTPFSSLVMQAFEAAGAEPLLEDDGIDDEEVPPVAAADEGGCSLGTHGLHASSGLGGLAVLTAAAIGLSLRRRR